MRKVAATPKEFLSATFLTSGGQPFYYCGPKMICEFLSRASPTLLAKVHIISIHVNIFSSWGLAGRTSIARGSQNLMVVILIDIIKTKMFKMITISIHRYQTQLYLAIILLIL